MFMELEKKRGTQEEQEEKRKYFLFLKDQYPEQSVETLTKKIGMSRAWGFNTLKRETIRSQKRGKKARIGTVEKDVFKKQLFAEDSIFKNKIWTVDKIRDLEELKMNKRRPSKQSINKVLEEWGIISNKGVLDMNKAFTKSNKYKKLLIEVKQTKTEVYFSDFSTLRENVFSAISRKGEIVFYITGEVNDESFYDFLEALHSYSTAGKRTNQLYLYATRFTDFFNERKEWLQKNKDRIKLIKQLGLTPKPQIKQGARVFRWE